MDGRHLPVLVVADDLTGANDTSVMFAQANFDTVLVMDPDAIAAATEADVTALALATRPLFDDAAPLTEAAVIRALGAGFRRLYLKVDSTMRGSVAQQVQGALAGWRTLHPDARAVICPAYPVMGRTVTGGSLLVDGIPVTDTASGRDPVCPVTTPVMTELTPGAVSLSIDTDPEGLANAISSAPADRIVVDATSQEDLDTLAAAVALLGDAVVPVGSAGFAQALQKVWAEGTRGRRPYPEPRSGRSLLVVSSIHSTSQDQVDQLLASPAGADAIVFAPAAAQLANPDAVEALTGQLRAVMASGGGTLIIRANPVALLPDPQEREQAARHFANQIAALARAALDHEAFADVLLIGGDGAVATLKAMDVARLQVIRPLTEGVPLGIVRGGPFEGLPVATKSGGFGAPSLLIEVMGQRPGA